MSSVAQYASLASFIDAHSSNNVFTLHYEDRSSVDLSLAQPGASVLCMSLTSPDDSMTILWVLGPWGCVVFPEVSVGSSVQDLVSSFAYYPPVVYSSAEEAARVTLTGQ
jgi:anti-sigma factor RsiW